VLLVIPDGAGDALVFFSKKKGSESASRMMELDDLAHRTHPEKRAPSRPSDSGEAQGRKREKQIAKSSGRSGTQPLARPEGFEPPTYGSVVRCSIH
jgi:hypothetical protein